MFLFLDEILERVDSSSKLFMLANLTVMRRLNIFEQVIFQDLDSTAESAEIHSTPKTKRQKLKT